MLHQGFQCCQHSMKKGLLTGEQYGTCSARRCSVLLLFGLFCCAILPNGVGASFSPPAGCETVSFKFTSDSQKIQNISCQHLNLTAVPSDSKEGGDVFKFDLSHNQISSIDASDFQYFSILVELDLSYNQISSLPTDAFDNLTSLQSLNLAANNFIGIDADVFVGTSIRYLDISSMRYLRISEPSGVLRLYSLNISNIGLPFLPPSIIENIDSLEEIDVSYNNITQLESNLFKETSVVRIILSHNQIGTVDKNFMNDANAVTNLSVSYVDLSHNKLTSLDDNVFNDTPWLETLYLSDNLLTTLPERIFRGSRNLKYLDLSHNSIAELPSNIFGSCTSIETIDLSNNNLQTLNSSFLSFPREVAIDLSSNPFVCECNGKEMLFNLAYAQNVITNVDETKCTDGAMVEHIYMDYSDRSCSGNLGSVCSSINDCMVRNSVCSNGVCVCDSQYYDNNGDGTAMGLCKAKVELGESCTMDSMCRVLNSYCNSSSKCDCTAEYYDSNGTDTVGGECVIKVALNESCYESYECAPANSECINYRCSCSAGYYDFTNSGECLGPGEFYSCYTSGSESLDVEFSTSSERTSASKCGEECFQNDKRYYVYTTGVCMCGNLKTMLPGSIKCCPYVSASTGCDGKQYPGVASGYASAGIGVSHVPLLYYGAPHQFDFTSTLAVIDQFKVGFGDSQEVTTVSASSASVSHTYSYPGQFWISAYACVSAVNVCEIVSIPIAVQVPPSNLTTYITGVAKADVSSALTSYATIPMGYNFEFYWSKEYNGAISKKQGCPTGWTSHRTTCIKLVTSAADFTSASAACVGDNGQLLKLDFMNELSEIVARLSASSRSFLLGAQRSGGVWKWTSDNSKTVFNDADLADAAAGDCVKVDGSTGQLTSTSCSVSESYACMTDPVSCPHGGELMSNDYCYILVASSLKSYSDANTFCGTEYGGWLSNITDSVTHNKLTALLTAATLSEAWFGLNDAILEDYYMWADGTAFDYSHADYKPTITPADGDCFVTTDTSTWAEKDCAYPTNFFCQYSTIIDRIMVPTFLAGTPVIGIPSGESLVQLVPADTFTSAAPTAGYSVQIFPGMTFSRNGNIRYWTFRTINVAVGESYDISIQHYKPECSTGSLIQPGCASTMFATCSMSSSACTSSSMCSDSEQFCYLSNQCKPLNESCTCNSVNTSPAGITSCSSYGSSPSYKLSGQTSVTVTSSGSYVVAAGDISVEELDVIGIQYPHGSNVVLCEDLPTGDNQQTSYVGSADHWLTNAEYFPSKLSMVNSTCYIQAIFTQDHTEQLTSNLAYASTVGDYSLSATIIDGVSRSLSLQLEEAVADLSWVYPPISIPSTSTDSFGTVYMEWNTVYSLTMRVDHGTNLQSIWTVDSVNTTVSFFSTCDSTVESAMPNECNATLYWSDKPYTYLSHTPASVGTKTIYIQTKNDLGTVTKSLDIRTEKSISSVTFTLVTISLIANNVAVNRPAEFATVADGSGVSYSYTVDSVSVSAPASNSTLFHTFSTTGTFDVTVNVSNILGSQQETVTVDVKQAADFQNCQFLNTNPSVAAVGIDFRLQVQCELNNGAEVSTSWTLSDRTANISGGISTISSSPYTWLQSIRFSTVQTGVNVSAYIMDPFEQMSLSLSVDVYNAVTDLTVVSNVTSIFPNQAVNFNAAVPSSPGNYGTLNYSFDFGDGSTSTSSTGDVTHHFTNPGNYTISVTASNGPSSHTTTTFVTVFESVSGLLLTNDGPKALGSSITFTATESAGNFLSYQFVSIDFNVTIHDSYYTHTFTSAGEYNVTVTAFNDLSTMSATTTAFIMNAADIQISSFTIDGSNDIGCFQTTVPKQFEVSVIHYDARNVIYDWDFGNGITSFDDTYSKSQTYNTPSNYTVTVKAKYSPQSAETSQSKAICVQEIISSPSISLASPVALPSAGSVTKTVTVDLVTGSDVVYAWSTNATVTGSTTDAVLIVTFASENFYSISVNVSNEINSLVTCKVIEVIAVIDGLSIDCSSCTTKSGSFYVLAGTNYTFTASFSSGSGDTYTWDYGDGNTGTGISVTHTYATSGSYALKVVVSNAVTSSVEANVTVHVQVPITDVTLMAYGPDWSDDIVATGEKDLDIADDARFKAIVLPTGLDLEYVWQYDNGLLPVTSSSDIGSYMYNTTGQKNVSVTVRNEFSSRTQSFSFYAIEKLTELQVLENGTTVLDETSTHVTLVNTLYQYEMQSSQIVAGTVKFTFTLKEGNALLGSTQTQQYSHTFTSETTYTLTSFLQNSLTTLQKEYTIEVVQPLSGPSIVSSDPDGYITRGASIQLTGAVTGGAYPLYRYSYSVAPSGETLPSTNVSSNSVTITPGTVGLYVVTLEVYNDVSPSVFVNYTFNVMVGVSGVSISVVTPYPSAVVRGNSLTFTAVVTEGTGLSYSWKAWLAGTAVNDGTNETFTVTFTSQAVYNITLEVVNYASSESVYMEIYSQNAVPSFDINVSGATHIASIDQYALATNGAASFVHTIPSTGFLIFDWRLDGASAVSTESFTQTFTSTGVYAVSLNVSNRIDYKVESVVMVVQDELTGFGLSSCNATYVLNTGITMSVTYSGTNVTVEWDREGLTSATGDVSAFTYQLPGTYSINVTASNYVSEESIQCFITMQGTIDNLQITTSQYHYVGYPITFNVTGDYIDPATKVWSFSDGTFTTTDDNSLDHTFTTSGTYTLEITVSNDVSSKTVSITIELQQLLCNEPVLTAYGSTERTVRRSRPFELSVDVEIAGGCEEYTSKHEWKIYEASSCAGILGNEINITDIMTSTPTLKIPKNWLTWGTYCIVSSHGYENTPVTHSVRFNVTVVKSKLSAVLRGSNYRMTSVNSDLTLDGSQSMDPDEDTSAVMSFKWSCTQSMGSASAAAVCAAIDSITSSTASLPGLTLSLNDVYEITMYVYAPGRENDTATQTIAVVASNVPIFYMTCISCEADGHYYFVNSRGVAIESTCDSGCSSSSTYRWTVRDESTSTPVTIDNTQTTTGLTSRNFALKPSMLDSNKAYSFKLEITDNGLTGTSEMTLSPSSIPSSGICTVTPYSNIVPLQDSLTVSCSGISDADTLSSIYYKIVVGPSTSYGSTYIAYYGTKADNEIYLVPSIDGDVSLSVYAVNDYGSESFLSMKTISFAEPTLATGTNKLDFMITKMRSSMKGIARMNSPSEMLQYSLALLNYVNRLAEDSIGTVSERMALRDVIMRSLDGLPLTSLQSIQQMSSAMELISNHTDELSISTMEKVLATIETLKDQLKGVVRKGMDQEDISPNSLIKATNKMRTASQSLSSSNRETSDPTVLAMFEPEEDYMLSISSGLTTTTYSSEDARMQAMASKTMEYSVDLLIVSLTAQLADEDEISVHFGDGSEVIARHISSQRATESVSLSGMLITVGNALGHINYGQSSVFQYAMLSSLNPFNFGYTAVMPVNTMTLTFAFHDTSGDELSISGLPENDNTNMYMFLSGVTPFEVNETGLIHSAGYNPLSGIIYSSKTLSSDRNYQVHIQHPGEANTAIQIQIRVNFSSTNNPNAKLSARLFKNGQPYRLADNSNYEIEIDDALMSDLTADHRQYTFFILQSDVGMDNAFSVKLNGNVNLEVSIGTYYSKCEYFDEDALLWKSDGCVAQDESIPSVISCRCNHLTSFGGSLLVSPDQLDFTDLSEVDFSSNPVAIITCSVILFLYIVLLIAFKRMDIMDLKRISLIPLCGKDGSFKYEVTIVTGRLPRAGTTAHVGIRLIGEYGKSVRQHVSKPGAFQRNCSDTFFVAYDVNLGDLRKIQIWHDNSGTSPSWYLSHVIVNDLQTDQKYYFFGNKWLTLEDENGTIQKEIKVAGSHELTRFSHRMKTATFNALADKHIWLSLFNRPAQSRFTRTQRVTCCATILYVFVGVNAMWYGLLKKDNTELSLGDFGWEEIVLALVSNVMVLPISVGLVFLFKKSRAKPSLFKDIQKPQTAQTLEIENLCDNSQGGSFESHNTGAVPFDLERESTIDSVPHAALGLHRSRHVAKTHRENTDDSLKRPGVAVTKASSRSPLWNEDGIMKWPDTVPTYDDGQDSRPSTGSTMAGAPAIKQPPVKAGGSTPGVARKTHKGDAGQLLAELDKLEQDLKETESQSGKSGSQRRSSNNLRRPTMHKSNWGSLEDILNSDDESVADTANRLRKRDSTTSQSTVRKFNPRADPRINGNGSDWPKSRESSNSGSGQRRGVTAGLRPGYYSEMTMESRDIHAPDNKPKCTLPPWCIYIAYIMCFLLSVFSVIIVILYCFKFGYNESVEWVLALILSLVLSFLIIEPLKALVIAAYVVAMFKNVEQDEDEDFVDIEPTFDHSNEKIKDVKFKPISGFALLQAKEEGRKIHRMKVIIRQFIAYIFYLWLIMVIVYVNFNQDSYLMTKHVEQDIIAPTTSSHLNFTNITSTNDFWDWTENVFPPSLYKENYTDEEHGYLLGAPRLRLIRGLTSKCEAADAAFGLGVGSLTDRTCHGEGTYDEDTNDYSESWNESNSNKSWKHFTAGQLGSTHKIGHVATYGGGGYPQVLGTSLSETDTILSHLKDQGWIDLQTRAVIFEFALYSPGSDITSMVALLAEFPLTGGVITSYEIQSQKLLWFQERSVDPLIVLEVILFFVIVYSVIHITLQIREHRKAFFKDIWNWYEMLTTLMALVSVGMYIGCVVEATNTFNNLLEDLNGFTNFERVTYVHVGMRYLHAWLLFLLMFKVVKQLRFSKFMYVYELTLSKAVGQLLGSGLIFIILLLVYAQVGNLMYGRVLSNFESVGHSIVTLVVMIRGRFDFWPMLDHHRVFSHFYVYSFYAFGYGILIALVISILTSTYKVVKSQMYYTSTLEMQDYEMVEFMLKRFKLWAGIQKPKPAFRRVRFPGLPSISSRSSSSYSDRSSASLQSSHSLSGQQYSEIQLRCMMARLQPTWQAVQKCMEKIVSLDVEEENLVKRAENEMKDLNWKCRINELERQHKELLSWKNQSGSSKPPAGDAKNRQSILKRLSRKDNQDRKAPATVSGAPSRTAASTPADDNNGERAAQGRRPLSDQGARVEPSTSKGHSSSTEKSKLQTFFKSIKPSKSVWHK